MILNLVTVGNGAAVLSVIVDDQTRVAESWRVWNGTTEPLAVDLQVNKNKILTVMFPPGESSGNIPGNRRWNIDEESNATKFEVTSAV